MNYENKEYVGSRDHFSGMGDFDIPDCTHSFLIIREGSSTSRSGYLFREISMVSFFLGQKVLSLS